MQKTGRVKFGKYVLVLWALAVVVLLLLYAVPAADETPTYDGATLVFTREEGFFHG